MKKILVTGSSGQSGRAIIDLLEKNYQIRGVDLVAGEKTQMTGDLSDRGFVRRAVQGMDAVIHTASLHAPHVPTHSRERFIEVNIKGMLYLLEAAVEEGIRRLVYTSSTSVFGQALENHVQAVWVTEELRPLPRDIYDITKLAAEELCRDFHRTHGLSVACLRVSRFWNEALEKRVFYRMYRGLDVRDVAQAHQRALELPELGCETFIISAQPVFDPEELMAIRTNPWPVIERKVPGLAALYHQNGWAQPGEIDRVYVIDKAKRILGYRPVYNVDYFLGVKTGIPR